MDKLLEFFKNKNRLAKALGVSRQAVSAFFKAGSLPPGRAIQVEKLTEGKIKAFELI